MDSLYIDPARAIQLILAHDVAVGDAHEAHGCCGDCYLWREEPSEALVEASKQLFVALVGREPVAGERSAMIDNGGYST